MTELHISLEDAKWGVPLPALLLMARESQRQIDKNAMNLQDKEQIDEILEREKNNGD